MWTNESIVWAEKHWYSFNANIQKWLYIFHAVHIPLHQGAFPFQKTKWTKKQTKIENTSIIYMADNELLQNLTNTQHKEWDRKPNNPTQHIFKSQNQ